MKKTFTPPVCEVILLSDNDVITTSRTDLDMAYYAAQDDGIDLPEFKNIYQ